MCKHLKDAAPDRHLLTVLSKHGGASQADLADVFRAPITMVGGWLSRLAAAGFVAEHHRNYWIATARGKNALEIYRLGRTA